jgi:hypothetical protein
MPASPCPICDLPVEEEDSHVCLVAADGTRVLIHDGCIKRFSGRD